MMSHKGIHAYYNPDATEEKIKEWERMVKDLEERTRNNPTLKGGEKIATDRK